jgi:UDP-N-acetylglucosamine--N-acetylmuramyl-(pentapeptide) pyrophosphoryl-undecaprenol N-acetylglucosamine transferase
MSPDLNQKPVVLAAGGTGGHIFPAEALAESLMAAGERVILVTDHRFSHFQTGALSQVEKRIIRAGTVGGSLPKKILGIASLALGIVQAHLLVRKLKPKVVIGFGGYPSFPTMFAASGLRIPTIVHEQNSVLGRANRLLENRVNYIATSFPDTQMLGVQNKPKVRMTGNPVRHSVCSLRDVPYPNIPQDGQMHILVTGGSQGASVFSRVVPEAIALLPAALRARVRIDQQCRQADIETARTRYAELGVSADLAAFFVDLPARLAASHLVIARSGASTVCELAVAGRPGILVPLPTSMDNHQYYNAQALEQSGGGWVMTQDGFTPASLAARLEAFLTAPQTLERAAESARKFGAPDAASKLAALVDTVGKGGHVPPQEFTLNDFMHGVAA